MARDTSSLLPFDALDGGYFRVPDELITSGAIAAWDGATLRVYLVLLRYRNRESGRAFPSMSKLADLTQLNRGTVCRSVRVLHEWGAIETGDVGWRLLRPVAPAQRSAEPDAQAQQVEPVAPAQPKAEPVAPALQSVAPALRSVAPALGAYKEEPNTLTQHTNPTPRAPLPTFAGDGPTDGQIYDAYPLKVARAAALGKIAAAVKRLAASGPPPPDYPTWRAWLLARTMAYADARRREAEARLDAPKYTPHAATWFNQERYHDDPTTWAPHARGATSATKTPDQSERSRGEYASGMPTGEAALKAKRERAARAAEEAGPRAGAAALAR